MSIVTKKQALWIVLGCVLTVAAVTAGVEAYKTKMKPIWDYKAYQAKSGTRRLRPVRSAARL